MSTAALEWPTEGHTSDVLLRQVDARHHACVFRIVRSIFGRTIADDATVADAVQDAALRLLRRAYPCDDLKRYWISAAANVLRDGQKSWRAQKCVPLPTDATMAPEDAAAFDAASAERPYDPIRELSRAEIRCAVDRFLEQGGDTRSPVFRWEYVDGLAMHEIVQRLGVLPPAARMRASRERARFRRFVATHYPDYLDGQVAA